MSVIKCAIRGCNRRFARRAWNHKFCKKHASEQGYKHRFEYEQRLKQRDPIGRNAYHRHRQQRHRDATKFEVLSFYGKNGTAVCCWRGCGVFDLDMLSLDHKDNQGKRDRIKFGGGHRMYLWVKSRDFPAGFQTLCFNHQFKKEISRRKKNRK